ncbi:phospholipid scramblase-related protein [Solitalea canadensis]|uniref:Scramblase n=1 Tax=Solitalea canadensis (strain ATCC 29591 / DSM 3403 / JCM 21819 / LMG 8368 / NBRC 15130 / NCIMB 12057 / USAM 9D) TaxID=929556 RepID=H8KL30_SOLCM|nr:phospholipid scramblase-related protein [Solitalea canadensis]AFD08847.1 Scramblase [Solitalea canadensis DSM 3403]
MHPILSKNQFFIKEHVGMFKAANNFDILDLETQETLMLCREPNLGFFTKMFRFTDYKRMTPFEIKITDNSQNELITIKRGVSIFLSKVDVLDQSGKVIGKFKQKFFSIGGKFDVLDSDERPICTLKGKWTSWDFSFMKGDVQLAKVTKKWAGLGKELFTSADNYVLQIEDHVPQNSDERKLILAAVMCIDMVLKE